jgi:hypothetical protein
MLSSPLPVLLSVLAFSVSAAEVTASGASLEPCINGAVSASGAFPTQAMEEQVNGDLARSEQKSRPHQLVRVAADRSSTASP